MSDYRKRNNKKFDIDARGIRSSWARIDRLYDGNNRLPNDSEQFGRQVLDYVSSLINDVEGASLSALRNFDSDLIRTGDGYGNRDWVLNDEYSPAVVAAYAPLVRYLTGSADNNFFDTNGGLRPGRFKNEYNIVVTDSDGVISTKNIYTLLKLNFDDWLGLDFFARNKIAKRVAEGYDEDSELATSVAASVKRVLGDSTDPVRIRGNLTVDGSTTLNGDLILGDAAADSLVVNATTDFTNGVDLLGNVNIGDAASDILTITSTTSLLNNTTIGSSTADFLTVNSDTSFNHHVNLGNGSGDNITINGRIDSNIIPDADNTYDLGTTGLEWRNAYFDGTVRTDAARVDGLAGTGVRNVTVDAAGNLTTATPTAQVALIIYNSSGGVLKTIYGNSA